MSTRLERLAAELAALRAESEALVQDEPGMSLVRTRGTAEQERAALKRRQLLAREKADEIQAKAEEMKEEMQRMVREASTALGPLREHMRQLEEGIWTIQLYLGSAETLYRLRDGEPAPADVPVTVRQLVLYMDEECAVDAEEGGIDFRSLERFDDWLLEDPAHLDQVLPEPKGVVALLPRRHGKEYGDPWLHQAGAEENRRTYFLIRNGEAVYRTTTRFDVGPTLIPQTDEFTSLFETRGDWDHETGQLGPRKPLEPGSREWERAADAADARQRHYMRVALILQGLVDRTPIFHPLPTAGLSFLDESHHEDGRVAFINDAERSIGTGAESFDAWHKRLNAEMRRGIRVILAPHGFRDFNNDYGNSRISPNRASYPPALTPLVIEDQQGRDFIIRYERSDEVWDPDHFEPSPERPGWGRYGKYRTPKTRASAVIRKDDWFVLPFDLAEVEDMERFLRSRLDRAGYLEMFPILKAAIRAKKEERAAEEPFAEMMTGVLLRDVGTAPSPEEMRDLIDWYKLANKVHRPLVAGTQTVPVDPKTGVDEAKAVRLIRREWRARLEARARPWDETLVADLAERGALAVLRRRDGRYVMVSDEGHGPYVRLTEFKADGSVAEEARWQLPRSGTVARWQLLWSSGERWETWPLNASPAQHLTLPEWMELVAKVSAKERLIAAAWIEKEQRFETWQLGDPDRGGELEAVETRYTWRRERGAVRLRRAHDWGTWAWRRDKPPWRWRGELVYLDKGAERALLTEVRKRERARAAERAVSEAAWRLWRDIEQAWEADWWEGQRVKFVVEIGDPDLWPAERKMRESGRDRVRIPDVPEKEALSKLTHALAEAGIVPDGVTVQEAMSLVADAGPFEIQDTRNLRVLGLRPWEPAPEPEEDPEDVEEPAEEPQSAYPDAIDVEAEEEDAPALPSGREEA